MKVLALSLILTSVFSAALWAQQYDKPKSAEPSAAPESTAEGPTFLNQTNVYWSGQNTKISVTAIKYYLQLGKGLEIPLYVITAPSLNAQNNDIIGVFEALQNPDGGVLNTKLAYADRISLLELFRFDDPNNGWFWSAGGGYKMVSAEIASSKDFLFYNQVSASVGTRLVLPVVQDDTVHTRAGSLILGASANYGAVFSDRDAWNILDRGVIDFWNIDSYLNFFLSDQLNLSAGGTFLSGSLFQRGPENPKNSFRFGAALVN